MDKEHNLNWFKFADTDLATVEYILSMRPLPCEIICFHCQQSVEKYLKGYLIYNGIEQPPKIHDLIELCKLCRDFDTRFDEIADMCGYLSDYGVQPRYPDEMQINEQAMQKAVQYARKIKAFEPIIAVRQALENQAQT